MVGDDSLLSHDALFGRMMMEIYGLFRGGPLFARLQAIAMGDLPTHPFTAAMRISIRSLVAELLLVFTIPGTGGGQYLSVNQIQHVQWPEYCT